MGDKAGPSGLGEPMTDMMARLRLNVVEAKAMVLEDEDDADPIDLDLVIVGKVMA